MTPEEREKAELPSFGPTILPEPDTSPPPTPISEGVCVLSSLGRFSLLVKYLHYHHHHHCTTTTTTTTTIIIATQPVVDPRPIQ